MIYQDKYVFLKPVDPKINIVPVMTFQFEAGHGQSSLKIRCAMFTRDDEDKLAAIGYRFDSPTASTSDANKHSFYHVQPIKNLTLNEGHVLPCPQWIPERQPSIPLDAKDALTLFVSFLVSLYGRSYLAGLFSVSSFGPKLRSYVKDMHIGR
ncbi:MAG: hypothetical protein HC853_00805 [Anaerolineae bacterium]|nr:hypothetical protein [Anaerolineae bacterium]